MNNKTRDCHILLKKERNGILLTRYNIRVKRRGKTNESPRLRYKHPGGTLIQMWYTSLSQHLKSELTRIYNPGKKMLPHL